MKILDSGYELFNNIVMIFALIICLIMYAMYSATVLSKDPKRKQNKITIIPYIVLFVISIAAYLMPIMTAKEKNGYIIYTPNYILKMLFALLISIFIFIIIDLIYWIKLKNKKENGRKFIEKTLSIKVEDVKKELKKENTKIEEELKDKKRRKRKRKPHTKKEDTKSK